MSIPLSSMPLTRQVWQATRRSHALPWTLVLIWGALLLNVLPYSASSQLLIPVPNPVGKLVTQGALLLALLLALAVNRRVLLLPNLFLILLTTLAVLGLIASIHSEFLFGSTYRASRLLLFVLVLWLLTPWWGRRDMLILRCHRWLLWVVLGTVILGAVVSPGRAFAFEGRLAGILWPIWPTGVAHFAAILFGTSLVLWMCQVIGGRHASVALAISVAVLMATHTRTAVAGTLLGLALATASLFLGHVRARRISVFGLLAIVVSATLFASSLTTWALRGQSAYQASQLTGRTTVWSAVFDTPRPLVEQLFGSGVSNQSFHGKPIDSSWVSTFYDLGVLGVIIQASLFLVLIAMATARERGPQRATGLFLVGYVLVASITETGVGTASPYLLDLTVAAALLSPPPQRRTP